VSTPAFKLPSFAKINCSLRVVGRRADGYHEVRTVLQTISLHDDLHFALRDNEEIQLSCDDWRIPTDEHNLIIRAAHALQKRSHNRNGATIHLEKRIPAKGGLGGASSNAAVALLGLAHLWRLDISAAELTGIGATLGADVPFFFVGGRALATGIGTELNALPDNPKEHLLVVTPNATVSTAEAYKSLRAPALTTSVVASILTSSCSANEFRDTDQSELHNDFERVIFEIEPEIKRAKDALLRSGASGALLTGSGSSVFGIFDNQQAQESALREIQAEAGWRIFPVVTVSRYEYLQALSATGVPSLHPLT
jgi:4-diphosphocytidyl-2-C-methyl-D-erythritol kinase